MFDTVTIFGSLVGTGVSLFLLLARKTLATKLLGIYLAFITLGLAEPLISDWSSSRSLEWLAAAYFMIGPILLFYTKLNVDVNYKLPAKSLVHFTPAVIYLLVVLLEPMAFPSGSVIEALDVLGYELMFLLIFIYLGASLRLVLIHQKVISIIENLRARQIKMAWLKYLNISSIGMFATSFAIGHLQMIAGNTLVQSLYLIIQLSIVLIILLIALLNTDTMNERKFGS